MEDAETLNPASDASDSDEPTSVETVPENQEDNSNENQEENKEEKSDDISNQADDDSNKTDIPENQNTEDNSENKEEINSENKEENDTETDKGTELKEEEKPENIPEKLDEMPEEMSLKELGDDNDTPIDENVPDDISSEYIRGELTAADLQNVETEDEAVQTLSIRNNLPRKMALGIARNIMSGPLRGSVSLDGTTIDSITARWITEDTVDNGDPALLYVKPSSEETQVRLQVNYSLSGEHKYAAGDIVFTVPAYFIENRAGNDYGQMIIPYPENPSMKSDFNWILDGDHYLITNTKEMSAATQGYIQFAVTGLDPFELVDMQTQRPFSATVEVVTHRGNLLTQTSNELNVQFDTEAKVTNATKQTSNTPYRVSKDEIPVEQQIPGEEEYIVADWYVYGYIEATTKYTLEIIDTVNDHNGFVIKNSYTEGGSPATATYTNQKLDGRTYYSFFRTAYPASQFEPGIMYDFENTVMFRVTEIDDASNGDPKLVTTETDNAIQHYIYYLPQWTIPYGNFMLTKNGNDGTEGRNQTHHMYYMYAYDDTHIWLRRNPIDLWYGIYPAALNRIEKGQSVQVSYTLNSVGYLLPFTYVATADPNSEKMLSNYFKRPIQMVTEDVSTKLGATGLTIFDDYTFAALEFPEAPLIYKANAHNLNLDGSYASLTGGDATFLYEQDTEAANIPDVSVQIYYGDAWHDYATVSWKTGNCVITGGTTAGSNKLLLPSNTENFRTIVTSQTTAAIDYDVRAIIELKSNPLTKAAADAAFALSNMPSIPLNNSAVMRAYYADTNEEIVNIPKTGQDSLRGYTTNVSVTPEKKSEQSITDVDMDNRNVVIHYSANVKESSFISNKNTYLEAVAEGEIIPETGCIWYDLLPKGVTPVLSSVELREGDSIDNIYTLENYKGTGRTLLVVECTLEPNLTTYEVGEALKYWEDVPEIKFDAIYDFDSMIDYGTSIHNVIAFESKNDSLGTTKNYSGETSPTSGNNIATERAFASEEEKTAMTNLNPAHTTPSYVYAGKTTEIDTISAARTSLFKDVMVNNDGYYSDGLYYGHREENARDVYEGGQYVYRLRMMSNDSTISKNLIMYDTLENFHARDGHDQVDINAPRWQGTFDGIDTSQLEAMGCAPVVYYSTTPNLVLGNEDTEVTANTNLSSSIWIKKENYTGPISNVKAVAVDARFKGDGTPFMLEPLESAVVLIHMRAPSGAEAAGYIANDAHAYNNGYLKAISVDKDTMNESELRFIHIDYTKVGLEEYSIKVTKEWDDDDNRDGIRPTQAIVHLYANGVDTGKSLTFTGNETKTFEHLAYLDPSGNKIIYSFVEEAVPGYRASIEVDGLNATIKNIHDPERINISGTKTWVGDDDSIRPEVLTLVLCKNGESYQQTTIRPNTDGWSYEFNNLFRYENGQEIEYTIKEIGNKSYIMSFDGWNIVNTYHPFGDLSVEKYVENTTEVSKDKLFTFTFTFTKEEGGEDVPLSDRFPYTIYEGDTVKGTGTVTSSETISIKGGQRILIQEIPENTKYVIDEADTPGFKLTYRFNARGLIAPNEEIHAEFNNTYSAEGKISFTTKKTLLNAELKKYLFKFDVFDEEYNPVRSASNGRVENTVLRPDDTIESSEASVTFGSLRFTQEDHGKTYNYTIKERNDARPGYVYDDTEYKLRVTVADNGDGTLSINHEIFNGENVPVNEIDFENKYEASGSIVLRAWKELQGQLPQEGEFEFELLSEELDSNGNNIVLQTKRNTADGSVVFDAIEYDEKDIGKTYHYFVREVKGNDPKVNYDDSVFGYSVSVSDRGDGTLGFSQTPCKVKTGIKASQTSGDRFEVLSTRDYILGDYPVNGPTAPANESDILNNYRDNYRPATAPNIYHEMVTNGWFSSETNVLPELKNKLIEIKDITDANYIIEPLIESSGSGCLYIDSLNSQRKLYLTDTDVHTSYDSSFDYSDAVFPDSFDLIKGTTNEEFYQFLVNHPKGTYAYLERNRSRSGNKMFHSIFYTEVRTDFDIVYIADEDTNDIPVFVNTLKDGKIAITKRLADAEGANPDQQFRFRVKLIGDGIEDRDLTFTSETVG